MISSIFSIRSFVDTKRYDAPLPTLFSHFIIIYINTKANFILPNKTQIFTNSLRSIIISSKEQNYWNIILLFNCMLPIYIYIYEICMCMFIHVLLCFECIPFILYMVKRLHATARARKSHFEQKSYGIFAYTLWT